MSKITLNYLSNGENIKKFTINVNCISCDGPFGADSLAGDGNFTLLLDSLRKEEVVIKFGGKSIKLPKSNTAKVISVRGKYFSFNLSF